MTGQELKAWIEQRYRTYAEAGGALAAHEKEIARWVRGGRPIPRRVERIVELLTRIEELEAKNKKGGRSAQAPA